MILLSVLVILVLSSCENGIVNPNGNSSKPDYSIYVISSDGALKYLYDEDSSVATKVFTISSTFTGKAINAGSFIAVPTEHGYQKLSFDLEDEGNIDLGFSPRILVLYDGTINAVAESTMLFSGTVVEFEDTINDAKPGPDGLYVAAGERVYTLPGKNPTMAQWTEPITAIAVDDTASIYIGINGAVLTSVGNVNVDGIVKKLILKEGYLYALTDAGNIYRIDVSDTNDVRSCSANITDFFITDDKIFYVSDLTDTFGVYNIDSCSSAFSKDIPGKELIGILVKEE